MVDKCEGRDGFVCDELSRSRFKNYTLTADNAALRTEVAFWIDQTIEARKESAPIEAMFWISVLTITIALFSFYVGVKYSSLFPS